ncbi:MAG: TonB-dependent receptor [Phenylobacterium sp.]|uniref:TonB-dependent receptor plug domain-containing protein n=1 Tax=Phenylobacterium sp. TaxID=1871053 RepID=UPI0027306CDE|nr:TonB-dependent receptor [Phenylobacterium sp.]MDP2010206.1 TonB-dependent receptor [Phenylobacterium sp.]
MTRQRPTNLRWLSTASLLALACATPALAQAPASTPAPRGETAPDAGASFPAAFFAQYNPVTAADMVARVPGFELRDGDDRRGFAATAGNLLVNGERPSSKAAPSDLLKRIPAASVLRIELLSGSNSTIDIRGQSQVVNVVVNRATRADSATTFVAGLRHIQYSNRIGWALQASRTLSLTPTAELALDIQAPNTLGRGVVRERLASGAGVFTGTRYQVSKANNRTLQGSASLRWRPSPADAVNFNLQYVPVWNGSESVQLETVASGVLRSSLDGDIAYKNNYSAEFGGDWERRFGADLTVKLIGLVSHTSVDQLDSFDIFTAPAARTLRTQDRTTRSGERIGRMQVKWDASPAHTLEFGGEGAFNFRDTTLDIINQPQGGPAVRVPLAVANARVEELRGEVYANDIWTVSPRLSVETGVNFEVSRITQTGDQTKERSFNYVKPHLTATYAFDPRTTVRLVLQRDVAQLDFAEFSSAVDFLNTSTIQGNPDLVPERAWKSRLELERRFDQKAAITLAAFADRVEDVHDLVVVGGLDAYGNIGKGTRAGVEARATIPLRGVGLPNAELRLSGLYQQTRVTDPITGEARSFSIPLERQGSAAGSATLNTANKDWAYLVNFRQNLPDISAAWGATLLQWAGRQEYRRAEILEYVRPKPRLDLFFETTAIKPVTLRLYVNNILVSSEERTRTFFQTDRSSGVVQRVEDRISLGGADGSRLVGFVISGRF